MEPLYTKFYLRSARRFKQNLRYYRKGLGLTQEDFAEQCGISAHYVATLEAVSYTHLDVYKRQVLYRRERAIATGLLRKT